MPSAAPSKVGTTTDQPTSPIMPKPNQTPCVDFRAFSLRAAFAPISPAKVGSFFEVLFGSSLMLQGRKATQKSSFQFRHRRAHALLVLVQRQKFFFHRRVQLAEVRSADRPTRSEEHTSELQSLRHLVCRLLLEKK